MRQPRVPTKEDLDSLQYCANAATYYREQARLALKRKLPYAVTGARHHLRVARGWQRRYDEIQQQAKERRRIGHIE